MGKHPKREIAVQTIKNYPTWKAGVVAEHIGLVEDMGHDKATEYIRQLRKRMKKNGELIVRPAMEKYAPDEDRLEDVKMLFELRGYDISKKAASAMLLMHCYWTMRLHGNIKAVCETMDLNDKLKNPLSFPEIERVCNLAQERGFDSLDPEKSAQAQIKGFVDAGINYTSDSLYFKFEVQEDELKHLKTIERPQSSTDPQGAPE